MRRRSRSGLNYSIPLHPMNSNTEICEFPSDPVLSRLPFAHSAVLYPMGFPLEVETNSPEVVQALRKSWQMFPQQFTETPLRMSVGVLEDGRPELPRPPLVRSRFNLLSIVSDANNFVTGDFNSGSIFGWVSSRLLEDVSFLRFHFLDVSILTVLQQLHLAPVHAALVARKGQGIAFCGNSAAGKSTLAYACARAGWTFVADDASFLLRRGSDRYAIGNSHVIHFRDSARDLFPELRECIAYTRPNGKFGMEAYTRNLPITTAPGTSIEHIVFLNRNGCEVPTLKSCRKTRAIDWCSRFSDWADDDTRLRQRETYRRLEACNVWEFEYRDLDSAIARLEDLIQ